MTLTVKKVERLKQRRGRFGDGHGLYLQVLSPTNHSWLLRYERGGKERWMGLGPTHAFSLEEARERARKARQQLADGIDPLTAKREAEQTRLAEQVRRVTFKQCAEMYLTLHRPSWKTRKHAQQWEKSLRTYAYPLLGELSVNDIDSAAVLKIVEPLWTTKTETASRVRGRIEAILDYASANGMRDGDNPARHIVSSLPKRSKVQKVKHHAALPFAQLPEFLVAVRQREGVSARALEFLILAAARTGEVFGATHAEINFDQKIWTIPANRMKAAREHRVPLCDRAIEILRALPREDGNAHVFIGARRGTGLSPLTFTMLLRRMGRSDVTGHGFRSTFRDWVAETTSYPNHVAEMALAHTISNAVERAYRRGNLFEKRVRLMNDWARFCSTTQPVAEGENVVTLRKA